MACWPYINKPARRCVSHPTSCRVSNMIFTPYSWDTMLLRAFSSWSMSSRVWITLFDISVVLLTCCGTNVGRSAVTISVPWRVPVLTHTGLCLQTTHSNQRKKGHCRSIQHKPSLHFSLIISFFPSFAEGWQIFVSIQKDGDLYLQYVTPSLPVSRME